MKKTYNKPQMDVVLMKVNSMLMTSGTVSGTSVRMSWEDTATDGEYGL